MSHLSSSDVRSLRCIAPGPCAISEEQVHELLDDELGAAQVAVLRAHLARCPACRARVLATERFLAVLRRQRRLVPRAPTSLQARVRLLRAAARAADDPSTPAE